MTVIPKVEWHYDEEHDTNDSKPWTAGDLEDLALALQDGGTIEGAAHFLCRWGTQDEVRKKAEELGLLPSVVSNLTTHGL